MDTGFQVNCSFKGKKMDIENSCFLSLRSVGLIWFGSGGGTCLINT